MSKKILFLILVFILALGTFLRFYRIKEVPLGLYPDEAMNGSNGQEAFETGNFKPFYQENNGREGLFINVQAVSVRIFGNYPWALRLVSAIIGSLTVLGVYMAARELFLPQTESKTEQGPDPQLQDAMREDRKRRATYIALFSAFFIATSYWHLNFSRIGFRAICFPLCASFGMAFLLRGLRARKISSLVAAGIFTGIGFHTYIGYRFIPFVMAFPILAHLYWYWKEKGTLMPLKDSSKPHSRPCVPCGVTLYLFVTFIVALPIGLYFLQHPADFTGRAAEVSIFSAESPAHEFLMTNLKTIGMFFVRGDCNWRHNYNCMPALYLPLQIALAAGTFIGLGRIFLGRKQSFRGAKSYFLGHYDIFPFIALFGWLFFMSLPATLTREGIPHALRSIGMIPPILILCGVGAFELLRMLLSFFEMQKNRWPQYSSQISRIQKELTVLALGALLLIPLYTYQLYFFKWAENPNTYEAMGTSLAHLGSYISTIPQDTKKYVIVNMGGTEVRGIPMPAQTVMFLTDTFTDTGRSRAHLTYLLPNQISQITENPGEHVMIFPLNGGDPNLISLLHSKFPAFKSIAESDFLVLKNYQN